MASTLSATLTPTQQLTICHAYGCLCDAWIDVIGVAAVSKNKALRKKCSQKDAEIGVLKKDVYVLCCSKFSDVSESEDATESASLRTAVPRPCLRRAEAGRSLDLVESITSMTAGNGHLLDAIDTEAIMASAKGRVADFGDLSDGNNYSDSNGNGHSASALGWDPSLSSMSSTASQMSLSFETQRVLRMHSPASASRTKTTAARVSRPTTVTAMSRTSASGIAPKQTLATAESLAASVKEETEVFLAFDDSTQTRTESSTHSTESRTKASPRIFAMRLSSLGF